MLSAEHAPQRLRGLYSAIPQAGNGVGAILAAIVFTPFTLLPEDSFLTWGWRIPFLLSIVVVAVGLYIRLRVKESPAFVSHIEQAHEETRAPIARAVRTHPKQMILGFLVGVGPNVATYIPSVYVLTYITDNLALAAWVGTVGLIIANSIKLFTLPFSGWLSDLFGRQKVFIAGASLTMATAFPMFWLLDTRSLVGVWLGMVLVLTFSLDLMLGSQQALLAEMFDTNIRYTGMAVSREVSSAVVGGTLPFMAAWLNGLTTGTWAISVLMIVLSAISLVGAGFTRDRRSISFTQLETEQVEAS